MRLRVLLLAAAVAVTGLLPAATAVASPVCDGADKTACGGRTFPEPQDAVTALQFEPTVSGLRSLEAEFPDLVDVEVIGTSAGGRELVSFSVTDETVTTDKRVVLAAQSIHGNEPGGREGGVRWLEDVLRDPDHPSRRHLDQVEVIQVLANPDGWAAGDPGAIGLGQWIRGNGNGAQLPGDLGGTDLNRNFPWRGWIPDDRTPVSEPETQAVVAFVRQLLDDGQDIVASVDIHGEVANAGALTMLASGQFDLDGAFTALDHARAIDRGVTEAIGGDPLLGGTPPVVIHASSEFGANNSGGSGSGFLGDWLAQVEGGSSTSTSTIELFSGDAGPGTSAASADLELIQLYRDTVAPIMSALVEEATIDRPRSITLPGTVGYVRDPATTDDPTISGESRTAMQFFDDLHPFLSVPLRSIAPDAVATSLEGLSGVIVPSAVARDGATTDALRAFAAGGGDVVLTDGGVTLLPDLLDGVAEADVRLVTDDFTIVNLDEPSDGNRDHPLIDGVRRIAFTLTEPATLGYQVTGGGDTPAWIVDRVAFEAAGGTTVGVTADATGLGVVEVGDGTVTTISTLLPPPTATNRNLYGLNDHGVLDVGYQVLTNALGGRIGPAAGPVDEERTLSRVAGDDRIATAVANSRLAFDTSEVALIARADAFPDALAGSVLAAVLDAPILLTARGSLSSATAVELERLGATRALVLGGPGAILEQVVDDLDALDLDTQRLGGQDRHETARIIARAVVDGTPAATAVVARSDAFPDALAASNLATALRVPVVLTPSSNLTADAAATLSESVEDDAPIIVAGGTTAIAPPVVFAIEQEGNAVERLEGPDRYATAIALARAAIERSDRTVDPLFIASGRAFPDALTAGPAAARLGGLLVLVDPSDLTASASTRDFLRARADDVTTAYIVGGPVAVSAGTEDAIRDVLGIADR